MTTTLNTTPRPSVIAVLGCEDFGPCDPEPSARCPHCGAEGRYVFTALMSDGTTKGMMKGCLNSFARDFCAVQCERALEKKMKAARGKAYLSKWDDQMITALDGFRAGTVSLETLRATCRHVAQQKQAWMKSKGYR